MLGVQTKSIGDRYALRHDSLLTSVKQPCVNVAEAAIIT